MLARRCYRLDLRGLCTNMCRLHTWKIVYVIDATVVEVLAVVFFFLFLFAVWMKVSSTSLQFHKIIITKIRYLYPVIVCLGTIGVAW